MPRIKILIADDHSILRDGVRSLLTRTKNLQIVGEATNGLEAVEMYKSLLPDILIMDISMPVKTGMEAACEIMDQYKGARIIMLSMHDDEEYIDRCLELGVKGYVVKNESGKELELAVSAVAGGKNYFSHQVQEVVFRKHTQTINKKKKRQEVEVKLTEREIDIVRLVAQGLTSMQMAEKLFISHRTVETHRANVFKKLNVKNAIELVKKAEALQLLTETS